jgi:hypothetical protein
METSMFTIAGLTASLFLMTAETSVDVEMLLANAIDGEIAASLSADDQLGPLTVDIGNIHESGDYICGSFDASVTHQNRQIRTGPYGFVARSGADIQALEIDVFNERLTEACPEIADERWVIYQRGETDSSIPSQIGSLLDRLN